MPLCLVFEGKKGTVCEAGLHRRVQLKCFVAELLSREQKVAHIVVVSFPLHQIKTFFSVGGWACSSWTHAGGWNEMSAAACKVKNKTEKQKKRQNQMWYFSTKHQWQQTQWNLAFCGLRQTILNSSLSSIANTQTFFPFPTLRAVALSDLRGSWGGLTDWGRSFVRYTVHDQPAMSAKARILCLVSGLITSLRRWKLLVNTLLKDTTDAKAEEQPSARTESYLSTREEQRYCIWLPTCFSPFGKLCR